MYCDRKDPVTYLLIDLTTRIATCIFFNGLISFGQALVFCHYELFSICRVES